MAHIKDYSDQRIGNFQILRATKERSCRRVVWMARCLRCGQPTKITIPCARRQKSCGCWRKERLRKHGDQSGGKIAPTLMSYKAMVARCKATEGAYANIKVCRRWLEGEDGLSGYECFKQDLGPRPPNTTLSRLHDMGNYELGNVVWGSLEDQQLEKKLKRKFFK